jgi:hypothetical protein
VRAIGKSDIEAAARIASEPTPRWPRAMVILRNTRIWLFPRD